MTYQIALDPKLAVSPTEFTAAWNQTPECLAVGKAYRSANASAEFDPQLQQAIVKVVSELCVSLAGAILYDLIKGVLARKGVTKRTEIIEVTQHDGTRVVMVKMEEGIRD
jgi:hypothetical protein